MRRPAHVAWAGGPTAHLAFVAAVVEALNWPDVSLAVAYFVRGLVVVGEAPDGPFPLPYGLRDAACGLEDFGF